MTSAWARYAVAVKVGTPAEMLAALEAALRETKR